MRAWAILFASMSFAATAEAAEKKPNLLIILADDVGVGELGAYGAKAVKTPNLDRLARRGQRFTDGHSPSATCTPSRCALLTGEYAWRRPGTNVLPGDAAPIITPDRPTLPAMLKGAGYHTGVIGKWHLGLGAGPGRTDWNGDITPGPQEIGFDYAFILPATGDRTPCVFVENRRVVGLDPKDPLRVSFSGPVGDEPTGKSHPQLLKMHPSHGHDMTIVNGISRIGYMSGGRAARWTDEDIADTLAGKASAFIERHKDGPFFLYFATHDIHVPRVPHRRFVGATTMGPRGDALVQLDATVGVLLKTLDRLNLTKDTLIVFSSDNGPVVDDGYKDEAVEKLGAHRPNGPFRGGKYSNFEGGTRVPFLVHWPARVRPGISPALVSYIDLYASLASLLGVKLEERAAPDSLDMLPALLGRARRGREELVVHANLRALRSGTWKYIPPGRGPAVSKNTGIETGNLPEAQLYDLARDPGERNNLASKEPGRAEEMAKRLAAIEASPRTRP